MLGYVFGINPKILSPIFSPTNNLYKFSLRLRLFFEEDNI